MGANHSGEAQRLRQFSQSPLVTGLSPGMHQGNGAGTDPCIPMSEERVLQLCIQAQGFHLLPVGVESPLRFNNRHGQRLRSWNL